MALTSNTPIKYVSHFNDVVNLPCAADVRIYDGAAVGLDADGYAAPYQAGYQFVGFSAKESNNTDGAAGDIYAHIKQGSYTAELSVTGLASERQHNYPVYAVDDGTFTIDPSAAASGNALIGYVEAYVSSGVGHVAVNAPTPLTVRGSMVDWFEDFIGYQLPESESGSTGTWATVEVGEGAVAHASDEHAVSCALTTTDEAQDATLYMGDELQFDIDKLLRVEFRAKVTTPGTGVKIVAGMAGNHNLDKDTIAQSAWFAWDGSLATVAETDDGTNNNDDVATGVTLTTATYADFMIDFSDSSDVRFYINGSRVASGTTFDMSNYTGNLQPYVSCDKASGAVGGAIVADTFHIVSTR